MQKLNLTAKPAMPPNPRSSGGVTGSEMEIDRPATSGEGLRTYYITKIEELMLTVTDKRQNTRRLQVSQDRKYRIFLFINLSLSRLNVTS